MRFITFEVAYLPAVDITKPVSCTVNPDHVSLVLPVESALSGARTELTVNGRAVQVELTHEEVVRLLNGAAIAK